MDAAQGFDPWTSRLWASRASSAPSRVPDNVLIAAYSNLSSLLPATQRLSFFSIATERLSLIKPLKVGTFPAASLVPRTGENAVTMKNFRLCGRALGTNATPGPVINSTRSTTSRPPLFLLAMPAAAGGAIAVGLYRSQDTVSETGRKRWMFVSSATEKRLGAHAYQRIIRSNKSDILPRDHKATKTVNRVAKRIVKVADRDFKWSFTVIRSDTANAFCLPGGKVVVYTGLFAATPNEDALAMILAHEIAHAVARHGAEKMSRAILLDWAVILLSAFGIEASWLLGLFDSLLLSLPNSRECEREADFIGLQLMAKACFNVEEGPKAMERLHDCTEGHSQRSSLAQKLSEYTSTHPSDEERVALLRDYLPPARELARKSGCSMQRRNFARSATVN